MVTGAGTITIEAVFIALQPPAGFDAVTVYELPDAGVTTMLLEVTDEPDHE
jgi:hypothetical protein